MSAKPAGLIIVATQNRDKLLELRRLMAGWNIEVRPLSDFGDMPKVHEDAPTFEGNAEKKARIYSKKTRSLVIADDSGLMVSALRGRPGVYSARFAGPGCTYQDNNRKLLKLLAGTPPSRRGAKFVCVASLYDKGKKIASVRGECRGRIAFAEKGKHGFGYDPVFIPAGRSKTFAEMGAPAKARLSHRGKALRAAKRAALRYLRKKTSS